MENALARLSTHNKTTGRLVFLITIILLVLFGKLPDSSLFWREVQNSGHTFLFAIAAVLILRVLQDSRYFFQKNPLKLYVMAGVISLLTGISTEFIQLILHSDISKIDVLRDLAGIIVGLGLYAGVDSCLRTRWLMLGKTKRIGITIFSLGVLAVSLFPLVYLSEAYAQREKAFPVVVDLTANWAEVFTRTQHAIIKVGSEHESETTSKVDGRVHVHLKSAAYPGLSLIEPYPDWSFFNILTLDVYSLLPETFDLVLRIHDQQHDHVLSDRFNRRITVKPGENYFRIPLHDIKYAPVGREMDMTQISGLILFSANSDTPINFYLGLISLE